MRWCCCLVESFPPSRPTRRCSRRSGIESTRWLRTSRCTPMTDRRRTTGSRRRSTGSCGRQERTGSTAFISSATRVEGRRRSPSPQLHGERLLSLALLEPAWAGNEQTPEEDALWEQFHALALLPTDQFMAGFTSLQLAPGVDPPERPSGEPPPWMTKRPAGLRAFIEEFDVADSTSTRYGRSTGRCTSHSAAGATPTTTPGSPNAWRRSSPTSRSRRSPTAITSTRRTESSRAPRRLAARALGARGGLRTPL